MSDEDEYLSEESYEFEFEDDEEVDVTSSVSHSHDTPVCLYHNSQPSSYTNLLGEPILLRKRPKR